MKPCATCRFFVTFVQGASLQHDTHPQLDGECRRRAPHPIVLKGGEQRSVWPIVHQSSGCGEHAPLERQVPAPPDTTGRAPGFGEPPF